MIVGEMHHPLLLLLFLLPPGNNILSLCAFAVLYVGVKLHRRLWQRRFHMIMVVSEGAH